MNIKKIILAFAASAMLAGGCTSLDMDPEIGRAHV